MTTLSIRYAYALYASSGSFDLECRDKLSIGTIKNILAIPINIGRRSDIRAEFDEVSRCFERVDSCYVMFVACFQW